MLGLDLSDDDLNKLLDLKENLPFDMRANPLFLLALCDRWKRVALLRTDPEFFKEYFSGEYELLYPHTAQEVKDEWNRLYSRLPKTVTNEWKGKLGDKPIKFLESVESLHLLEACAREYFVREILCSACEVRSINSSAILAFEKRGICTVEKSDQLLGEAENTIDRLNAAIMGELFKEEASAPSAQKDTNDFKPSRYFTSFGVAGCNLRRWAKEGMIRSRPGLGKQNDYSESDVRRVSPQSFPASKIV